MNEDDFDEKFSVNYKVEELEANHNTRRDRED